MRLPRVFVFTASLLACAAVASADVSTTFSTGFEGWSSVVPVGLSWQGAGGNPGGYVQFDDMGPALGGQLIAPGAYLGDWSPADGVGSLSVDFTIFTLNGGVPFTSPNITLTGPGGVATWAGPIAAPSLPWTTYAIPISAGSWTQQSGTWAGLLSNVTELRINISAATSTFSPGESTGLDNVVLRIPGPGAAVLPVALMLGAVRRRRPLTR